MLIVDEFTGRVLHGRRYNEGMHQAIEAKEGVRDQEENQTLATITLQNYFRLYDKLAGMTGTAQTEAAELHQIYKLGVVPIPTNMPMIRDDQSDLIYKTEDAKFDAVVEDIAERHEAGQPVLVGTASVEKSRAAVRSAAQRGIPHEVLNAKNHAREAPIVAQAGRQGAVTVATNMAGRGTDIKLGGNPEFSADCGAADRGLTPDETPEEYEAAWHAALEKAKAESQRRARRGRRAGGLYVLGTERHESRRIDNQLRGRSGRQGDPGESRFYLSLGDDLMRRFNAERVECDHEPAALPEDAPIEYKMVTRAIQSAQTQVEQQNFEIRKNVLKYDEVLNKQRTVIYDERRAGARGRRPARPDPADDRRRRRRYVDGRDRGRVRRGVGPRAAVDRAQDALPGLAHARGAIEDAGGDSGLDREFLIEELLADAHAAYDAREAELGSEVMRELERRVLLSVLDRKWREHLYEMDYLQEGIGLRAMAQRDPLVEYQREGFDMFRRCWTRSRRSRSASCSTSRWRSRTSSAAPADGADGLALAPSDTAAEGDGAADGEPHLDAALLAAAQRAQDGTSPGPNGAQPNGRSTAPHISAKGLDRDSSARPLIYSSPTLGSDTPEVRMTSEEESSSDQSSGTSSTARRQQNRRTIRTGAAAGTDPRAAISAGASAEGALVFYCAECVVRSRRPSGACIGQAG